MINHKLPLLLFVLVFTACGFAWFVIKEKPPVQVGAEKAHSTGGLIDSESQANAKSKTANPPQRKKAFWSENKK
jgi:hypothetical protein